MYGCMCRKEGCLPYYASFPLHPLLTMTFSIGTDIIYCRLQRSNQVKDNLFGLLQRQTTTACWARCMLLTMDHCMIKLDIFFYQRRHATVYLSLSLFYLDKISFSARNKTQTTAPIVEYSLR